LKAVVGVLTVACSGGKEEEERGANDHEGGEQLPLQKRGDSWKLFLPQLLGAMDKQTDFAGGGWRCQEIDGYYLAGCARAWAAAALLI
jgi:hypothetical protein